MQPAAFPLLLQAQREIAARFTPDQLAFLRTLGKHAQQAAPNAKDQPVVNSKGAYLPGPARPSARPAKAKAAPSETPALGRLEQELEKEFERHTGISAPQAPAAGGRQDRESRMDLVARTRRAPPAGSRD